MQMPPVDRSPNWRPQGADLHSAGTPVRSGTPPADPLPVRAPDKPSAPEALPHDWTMVKKKDTVEEPPEPLKEPIYKQLLELIRSMWRASGSAVEVAQDIHQQTLQERMAQQARNDPPTYIDDLKVRRTGNSL